MKKGQKMTLGIAEIMLCFKFYKAYSRNMCLMKKPT